MTAAIGTTAAALDQERSGARHHPARWLSAAQLQRALATFQAVAEESERLSCYWAARPEEPGAAKCASTWRRDADAIRAAAAEWEQVWRSCRPNAVLPTRLDSAEPGGPHRRASRRVIPVGTVAVRPLQAGGASRAR